ncbi:MAG: ATP-dependent RNA helicase HrpA [Candidatus Aminicenantes bacterium RBG_19FT_COMBO_65_30]|nr:MAG: ATP-dependent RNA helicase HrpA [Candidatus Aminicenantes bacterium RBG_19FT_COMBO_65_30]
MDRKDAARTRLESWLAARARNVPRVSYPRELPIAARADEIVAALRSPRRRVVIISGETGCGKSTQIPKMCLEAGRGINGRIGVTQPRRLAAVTIAYRIAEELGEPLGRSVGYKIRFQDRTARDGYIKVMTDGILLAETQGDRLLHEYDTIIIDEAHERSLNIDFLLGIMRKLLDERPELKLVITSATLDTEKFSKAFRNAPVIEVSGRHYPVELEYRPPDKEEAEDKDYVDQAVEAVEYLRREKPPGDILVFMPTEQDILETCRLLEGRKWPLVKVLPLFSRLPAGEQRMVYTVTVPKIVVATNVAETSLTIPGIRYVVDTGVARIARYQPGTRINSLPISPVSRASADQRKGRCGRVREGLCVRLYSETDFESREEFTSPEILRSDLAEVILRMTDLGLGDPLQFPFIDRPASKAVHDGYDTLVELGAIRKSGTQYPFPNSRWELTEKGEAMARMQLDPRLSRMLIEARAEGCLPEVAVLAAALSIRDPRERPPDKSAQADAVHAAFRHPDSDFLVLLNIWNRYHSDFEKLASLVQKRRFCHENFLSFPRMREWTYLHAEISSVLSEQSRRGQTLNHILSGSRSDRESQKKVYDLRFDPFLKMHTDISPALYGAIHRSILSGYLSNIAAHKEKHMYSGAKNREVMLWPGSVLFGKAAGWIVSTEVVRTSRLFARTAARVDPAWLEALGGPLCKRSYSDAAWDRARGEVTAKERVTLFGLEIVRERRVSYGRVNPAEAHEIFVMNGLVEGEVEDPPPFLSRNLALQRKVEAMEEKLRRRDILVAETEIAKFYSERLPGIRDIRTLRKLLKDVRDRGGDDSFLHLDEDALLNYRPGEDAVFAFPDSVEVAGRPFRAVYKFAPGEEDDGVTLTVPPELLSAIPADRLEWGVPGQYQDKIAALIKGLPKRYRKLLVPVGEKAETIAREMPQAPEEVALFKAVAEFAKRRFGVDIPPREWALADVPKYLRMRVAVTDPGTGRVIDAGRDVGLLRKKIGAADEAPSKIESPAWREAARTWEKTGLMAWCFGDLPEKIAVGTSLTAYPALVVEERETSAPHVGTSGEGTVGIRLFATRVEAAAAHPVGVRRLLMRKFAKELAFVRRYHKIPAELDRAALYFGGREAVEKAIEEGLARDVFERDIRTQAEYTAYEAEVGRTLFEKGHALTQTVVKIIELNAALRIELGKGGGGAGTGGAAGVKSSKKLSLYELSKLKERVKPEYLDAVAADLDRLVPKNFLEIYAVARLARIPRYLEGLKIRLERARIGPEKDKAKAAQLEPYAFELARLDAELNRIKQGQGIASPNSENRPAVEELRWMIEEFKLALFAPEIKTAFPISAVRLAKKIREIDAII